MLYDNETCCLIENELRILKRLKAKIRSICVSKLMVRKKTQELMCMLGVRNNHLNHLAKAEVDIFSFFIVNISVLF